VKKPDPWPEGLVGEGELFSEEKQGAGAEAGEVLPPLPPPCPPFPPFPPQTTQFHGNWNRDHRQGGEGLGEIPLRRGSPSGN